MISEIFGEEEFKDRVILTTTNSAAKDINEKIINEYLEGESKTYLSIDTTVEEDEMGENFNRNYTADYLHSLNISGVPPHSLTLKKNTVVILLRNLNNSIGLSNGTRLLIEELLSNSLKAKVLSGPLQGESIFIPQMTFSPSDSSLPFRLKRKQFPVIPGFAMTINKSQGQTFKMVGIDLENEVFSHGQLYVAISRCTSKDKTYIKVNNTAKNRRKSNGNIPVNNVVFESVL